LTMSLAISVSAAPATQPADPMPAFTPGSRILFQGHSITDMNRGRSADPNHILGHSYAFLIGARYGSLLPERVSGIHSRAGWETRPYLASTSSTSCPKSSSK
jgi:pimeloyl-ACP methyl ester carboxylesterase